MVMVSALPSTLNYENSENRTKFEKRALANRRQNLWRGVYFCYFWFRSKGSRKSYVSLHLSGGIGNVSLKKIETCQENAHVKVLAKPKARRTRKLFFTIKSNFGRVENCLIAKVLHFKLCNFPLLVDLKLKSHK